MKNGAIVVGLFLFGAAVFAGWQVGSPYLANTELQGDRKDLASLTGMRIGLVAPRTSYEIRDLVVAKATDRGVHLGPEQVNIERSGDGKEGSVYLSTEYDTRMNIFGFAWTMHFTAASPRS